MLEFIEFNEPTKEVSNSSQWSRFRSKHTNLTMIIVETRESLLASR